MHIGCVFYAYVLCKSSHIIWYKTSDNFSFQNNGIKSAHVGKECVFLVKQWFSKNKVFFKKQCLDTTSHMIWFDYKAYAFYQNKNYSYFT